MSLGVSSGQIISFTEDVKSREMLEGGRDSKDVINVSELYLLLTSVSLSSGSFDDRPRSETPSVLIDLDYDEIVLTRLCN